MNDWKEALDQAEMILVGIGSELEKKEENQKAVDDAYHAAAAFLKGKNYFVITGNRDGKLADGTIYPILTCYPEPEGKEDGWKRYTNWLSCTMGKKLVILELGTGFSDLQFLRWPFERIVMMNQKAALIRVGKTFPQIPAEIEERAFSVREDAAEFACALISDRKNLQP